MLIALLFCRAISQNCIILNLSYCLEAAVAVQVGQFQGPGQPLRNVRFGNGDPFPGHGLERRFAEKVNGRLRLHAQVHQRQRPGRQKGG